MSEEYGRGRDQDAWRNRNIGRDDQADRGAGGEGRSFGTGVSRYGGAGRDRYEWSDAEDRRYYPPERSRGYRGADAYRPDPGDILPGYGGAFPGGRDRYGVAEPRGVYRGAAGARGETAFAGRNERVERIADGDYDRGHFFGGGMNRPGGEHRGRGPKNYVRSDTRISEDVNDRLSDDEWLDASEIEAKVENGEVTLTGTVSRREDKRRAEDIAEGVSGVKHVQNNLRVQPAGGARSTSAATAADTAAPVRPGSVQ